MKRTGTKVLFLLLLLGPLVAWGRPAHVEKKILADTTANNAIGPQERALQRQRQSEKGIPFFSRHYAPQEYEQHHQNWDIVQDHRGVMYFANHDGVLEYDGTSWRLIRTLTNATVRSLAVGGSGVVYAGAQSDFGYLKPDSMGMLRYVSLIDEVRPRHRDFEDIWGTHTTSEGVYFQASKRLFRWNGSEMTSWESKSKEGFHTSFVVRDQFYVRDFERGLFEVTGDSLKLVPGGERFAGMSIYVMAPYSEGRILVGTSKKGFFLYDGASLEPFPMEADPFLQKKDIQLYHGCALPGGFYALATIGGGVLIIDEQGRLVQVLDYPAELPDGVVNSVYPDAQGQLWMALNSSGIVRADALSPLSLYNDRVGLKGVVRSIQQHQGVLYVATGTGLYYLAQQPLLARREGQRSSFVSVPLDNLPLSLLSTSYGLLVATSGGVYLVRNGQSRLILESDALGDAFTLYQSEYVDERVYVGQKNGLATLQYTGSSGWKQRSVDSLGAEIRSVMEEDRETLWMSTRGGNVLRARFSGDGPGDTLSVERFSTKDGLPDDYLYVESVAGKLAVASKKGLFRFDESISGRRRTEAGFYPDSTLIPPSAAEQDALLAFFETNDDNLWLVYPNRVVIGERQASGSYVWRTPDALRFPKYHEQQQLYVEENGMVWFGNGDQLIRYSPRVQARTGMEFPVLIRQVSALGAGAGVFGGTRTAEQRDEPTLEYEHNDLGFAFAKPSYNDLVQPRYQFYLEGAGGGWSEWGTDRTQVKYTNLTEGTYRFRVRAQDGLGRVQSTASYAFRILPPWYRTWGAYGVYLIAFLLMSLGYWRHRQVVLENERAREQARELARERLVNERLQEANERLKEANELKDEFLATTSHELRTPLTSILGFASILKEEVPKRHHEFLNYIEANGQRLMDTLNSLLDLAKIRAGMMDDKREQVNISEKTAEIVNMMMSLTRQKHIELILEQAEEPVYAYVDDSYFERILDNLIGNAIKFTEEGGVTVRISRDNEWACLEVRDTGVGIGEDFLPHLFEEFKQESSGLTRSHEGSGLGLALTARLVEVMGGEIHVESKKGEGSAFTVMLPATRSQVSESVKA